MTDFAESLERWGSDEGVRSAFAAARDGVDALLRDRGLRRTTPDVTSESLLRGAAASAALDGSASDLDDLRSGTADATAQAVARLNAELLLLVPVMRRSPLQVFARLHVLAARSAVRDGDLGRPRPDSGAAQGLREVSDALVRTTDAPGAVVAALVHAELVRIEPFVSHNGVVARACERLVLVARGVDPASVLVPEQAHAQRPAEYAAALAAYGHGDPAGRGIWLRYSADALTRAANASPLAG